MKNTRLIDLLRTFSTRERSRFRHFVHSPFFNKHVKLTALCDFILQFAPDFTHKDLEKEQVFLHLYGKKAYNENKLNNLISDLLQLLYDYLAHYRFEQQPVLQKQFLIEELLQREAFKHVEKNARRLRHLQEKSPERSYNYYQVAYQFYEQLDYYELSRAGKRFNENLQLESDHLDLYYLCNKFRLACEMASRNAIIKATYDCQLLEPLLTYYEARPELQKVIAIRVYHKTLQLLNDRNETQYFWELKELLTAHASIFPTAELHNLYNYSLNYCIQKINSGDSSFYKEILDIYKVMLEKEIIFVNGYLRQWSYKNIITTGIRLKDFDWTEWFIHHYKDRLLAEERGNAVAYNLAALYYAKSDLKNALLQLQDVEFNHSSYHLGAKIIQLKSYFELKEEEAFYALVEAFKKYLHRNRDISDFQKKANNNFLKLAKRLYKIKADKMLWSAADYQRRIKELNNRIEEAKPLANSNWLKAQLWQNQA